MKKYLYLKASRVPGKPLDSEWWVVGYWDSVPRAGGPWDVFVVESTWLGRASAADRVKRLNWGTPEERELALTVALSDLVAVTDHLDSPVRRRAVELLDKLESS